MGEKHRDCYRARQCRILILVESRMGGHTGCLHKLHFLLYWALESTLQLCHNTSAWLQSEFKVANCVTN